ncbi:MAG: TetR/AcrR family transcriptional regulator [Bacteroidota bacterium]
MPVYKTSKEEILKKAAVVFRQKGYFHTSIDDLAKACGLKKPHFYYYFKNKKELMEEVLRYVDRLMDKYICELAYDEKYSAAERLQKMLERMMKYYLTGKGGCIFGNTVLETANVNEDFKPIVKATFDNWAKAIAHILTDKYSEQEAQKMAFTIIQDLQGALVMYQLYGEDKHLVVPVERAKALLE